MKRKKIGWAIGLGITFVIILMFLLDSFTGIENKSIDWRFNFHQKKYQPDEIVIITVDEASVEKLGRWPWPRSVHAKMVDFLSKCGADTILFDILFSEPDKNNPESDLALAASTKRAGNVIHESFQHEAALTVVQKDGSKSTMYGGVSAKNPIPEIASAAAELGFANVNPDPDGITRRFTPFLSETDESRPYVGLVLAARHLKTTPKKLCSDLNLEPAEPIIINYLGKPETFKYYPYHYVLENMNDEQLRHSLKNKIVIIGGTALALFDIKISPTSSSFPGVAVIATTVYDLLNRTFIKTSVFGITLLICLIFGVFTTFIFLRANPVYSGAILVSSVVMYFLICWYFMIYRYTQVEFTAPTLILVLNYTFITLYRFVTEVKEKRWLKKAFGQYLSPAVINEIMKTPGALALGGKRQEMTVLFSDIRGFTTISEASSPEEIVALLNEYLTKMTEIVFKYEGTLDKFIGDAVMAFWNAPIRQKDHPRRAVLCAIDMIDELKKLQVKWRAEGKPVLDIGIGVNTGDMVVGNMGSLERMDYTVIGDNVNLGARLESLNKEFKTHIIISESTYNSVSDIVNAKSLGSTKVKGKEKAVQIYGVEGRA